MAQNDFPFGREKQPLSAWLALVRGGCDNEDEFRRVLTRRNRALGPMEPVTPVVEEFVKTTSLRVQRAVRIACQVNAPLRSKSLAPALQLICSYSEQLTINDNKQVKDPFQATEALKLIATLASRSDIRHIDDKLYAKLMPFALCGSDMVRNTATGALEYLLIPECKTAVDLTLYSARDRFTTDRTRASLLRVANRFPRDEIRDVSSTLDAILDVVEAFPTLGCLTAALQVVNQLLPDIRVLATKRKDTVDECIEVSLLLMAWIMRRLEADNRRDAQVQVAETLLSLAEVIAGLLRLSSTLDAAHIAMVLSELALRLVEALGQVVQKSTAEQGTLTDQPQPSLLSSVSTALESKIVKCGLEAFSALMSALATKSIAKENASWPRVVQQYLVLCDVILAQVVEEQPSRIIRCSFEKEEAVSNSLTRIFVSPMLAGFGGLILRDETWEARLVDGFSSIFLHVITHAEQAASSSSLHHTDASSLRRLLSSLANLCSGVLFFLDARMSEDPSAEEEFTRRAMNNWLSHAATAAFLPQKQTRWKIQCRLAWRFLSTFTDFQGRLLQGDKYFIAKVREMVDRLKPDDPMYNTVGRVLSAIVPEDLEHQTISSLSLGLDGLYQAGKNALTCSIMRPELARLCFKKIRTNWRFNSTDAMRSLHWIISLEKLAEAFKLVVHEQDSLVSSSKVIPVISAISQSKESLQLADAELTLQTMCLSFWEAYLKATIYIRSTEAEAGVGPGRTRARSYLTSLMLYVTQLTHRLGSTQLYPLEEALTIAMSQLDKGEPLPIVASGLHKTKFRIPHVFFSHQPRHIQLSLTIDNQDSYEDGLPVFSIASRKESQVMHTVRIPYTIYARAKTERGIETAKSLNDCIIEVVPIRGHSEANASPQSPLQTTQDQRCFLEEKRHEPRQYSYGVTLCGHGIASCRVQVKDCQTLLVKAMLRGGSTGVSGPGGVQAIKVKRVTVL